MQVAGWAMLGAHGLHLDQSMLAQAHAAMLTIENEGGCLPLHPATYTGLARLRYHICAAWQTPCAFCKY